MVIRCRRACTDLVEGDGATPRLTAATALDRRLRNRRQLHLPGQARLAGHRNRLRRQGGGQGTGEGRGRQRRFPNRAGRRHPPLRRGRRIELRADRRQRLPARHERRGPLRLRAGGDRGRRARCAAAAGRVHHGRLIRRAGHRPRRGRTSASRRAGRWCRRAANRRWTTTARTPAGTTCFSAPRRARRRRAGSPSAPDCAGVRRRRRTRRARCTPAAIGAPGP